MRSLDTSIKSSGLTRHSSTVLSVNMSLIATFVHLKTSFCDTLSESTLLSERWGVKVSGLSDSSLGVTMFYVENYCFFI